MDEYISQIYDNFVTLLMSIWMNILVKYMSTTQYYTGIYMRVKDKNVIESVINEDMGIPANKFE